VSDKLTRKELKQPDAFQKAGAEAGSWLADNQRTVVTAIAILLVGGLGVALANYSGERKESGADLALGEALRVLDRPVDPTGATSPRPGEPPAFKTEREKDEAVVAALGDFRGKHQGDRAALAALPYAQALYRLGKYDEAIAAFDEFLKNAKADDPMRAAALEGKGYAHEAKGELDQALAAFDQLSSNNPTEFLQGMGQYHKARIMIRQGKKEEGAKLLSEIPGTAPNTAAARLATERMALLTSEGVAVPPPATPAPAKPDGG
jgi:tetratricopeptide (TPR) repeat protein